MHQMHHFLQSQSQITVTDEPNEQQKPFSLAIKSQNPKTNVQIPNTSSIVESPCSMIDTQIVECDNPTIEDQPITSPIHLPVHTSDKTPSSNIQNVQPNKAPITHSNIPSSSNNEYFGPSTAYQIFKGVIRMNLHLH